MAIVTIQNSLASQTLSTAVGFFTLSDTIELQDKTQFVIGAVKSAVTIAGPLSMILSPEDYVFRIEYSQTQTTPPGQDYAIVPAAGLSLYNVEYFRSRSRECALFQRPINDANLVCLVYRSALLARGYSISDVISLTVEITIEYERIDKIQRLEKIDQLIKEIQKVA